MFDFLHRKKSLIKSGILKDATDRHSHILFGLDDGVATIEESLSILDFLEKQGLKKLWLTPHVMEDIPNTTEQILARFEELRTAYNGSIELAVAAEYMIDTVFEHRLEKRDLLTMEDNRILVETSIFQPPMGLFNILSSLKDYGYQPILAHPERYRYMSKGDYIDLHVMGVRMQMNYGSLMGFYGDTAKEKALMILGRRYYNYIGSDCHRESIILKQYNYSGLDKNVLGPVQKLWHR